MTGFPHQSRPGYYGITFTTTQREILAHLSDAMIPAGDNYPSASEAQVVQFVEERSSVDDVARLSTIEASLSGTARSDMGAVLRNLEEAEPETFIWLRQFIYHGYYSSHRVIAAMVDHGYDYHGAPQPLGYAITKEPRIPATHHGSFISTAEVTHVA